MDQVGSRDSLENEEPLFEAVEEGDEEEEEEDEGSIRMKQSQFLQL